METEKELTTPPIDLSNKVGNGDFNATGQEFKRYFIELGRLQPSATVLDVGCGAGRMAMPLSDYLTLGRYFGIDIIEPSIEWCQTKITPTYNNFAFQHSNIFNRFYNPNGTILAKDYVFPFEGESFDFVFLTSVFTHMLPEDLEHYLSEISRVLKKGGVCFITYFLLNNESVELIN
ncbi:Demethylrebeccamycin-D-glucose O-methyltransferase [Ephemeroptericola cinctiostellae]|uniref:Demethylrebeccamycin-D-glucose O-methyltransferase n=1 Tax=Ephemeroptericola cinctiostellae TaxID=2268024 RepID=A0A345DAE5_9BURK|nr:class I SAM-dependent methyltransferase [Ephemeroptericola cinctiostellae]AXF85333.1 Demethylrebeccamycin-D-glucose O-methyltransferase [Ephemeroptericola cinctiostellae]